MQQEATLATVGVAPPVVSRAGPEDRPVEAADLYPRYREDIFRYVSCRIVRREEAEDVTAEVFVAATRTWAQFRGRYEARLWLLGIARRKVIDSRRRLWRRRETLASENTEVREFSELAGAMQPSAGPEASLLRTEAIQKIRALVDSLKEEQREALLLQYLEDLTIAEIAVVMGRSPAAINSLLQRARTALHRWGQAYFSDLEGTNARTK